MSKHSSSRHSIVKELLIGFCLGTANIIPGVSGGTFLLVFNIYERVFAIISRINASTIRQFLVFAMGLWLPPFKERWTRFSDFLKQNDFIFLLKLMAGAVAAILSLSGLMKYLITYQFCMTYALFFGLILVSIIIPYRLLKKKTLFIGLMALTGAFLTVLLTVSVNPYDKVKMKSDMAQKQYQAGRPNTGSPVKNALIDGGAGNGAGEMLLNYSGRYSLQDYGYAAVCGGVSISAMVLPGVSGSLVLILMGEYFEVISAIASLKTLSIDGMMFLGCFTLGIVLGGLFFARLLNWVLIRWHDATMAFLSGLMIGSLYALWPFKKSIVLAHQYIHSDTGIRILDNVRVYTNINQLPGLDTELYSALAAFACGCIIMWFFVKQESEKPSAGQAG